MQKFIFAVSAAAGVLLAGCEERFEPPPEPSPAPDERPPDQARDGEPFDRETFDDDILDQEEMEREILEGMLPEDQDVELAEGIPVPEEYLLVSDREMGPMRITTLEVGEDLDRLVARFDRELQDSGYEVEPFEEQETEDGLYEARARLEGDEGRVTITVSEYGPEGALQAGNTGTVSYQVTEAFELEEEMTGEEEDEEEEEPGDGNSF